MVPVRYNLRSLLERRATSLMAVLDLGMVAMIFVILFGFIGGLKRTMLNAGTEHNWVGSIGRNRLQSAGWDWP